MGTGLAWALRRLGLQQGEVVSREAFLKLCDNQHPQTGEQLTPQQFQAAADILRLRLLPAQKRFDSGGDDE